MEFRGAAILQKCKYNLHRSAWSNFFCNLEEKSSLLCAEFESANENVLLCASLNRDRD